MTDAVRVGMPMAEFLELSAQQPFEIINGERRPVLPTVPEHSEVMRWLVRWLDAFVLAHELGELYFETTFILPTADPTNWVEGSRVPDIMFYSGRRIADYKANHPDWRKIPFPLVPDLVIEIISPNDRLSETDEKMDAYLADGVRLIWQIDPQRRKAIVFSPDAEQPHYLKTGDVLDGGDILPDFRLPLAELFAAIG